MPVSSPLSLSFFYCNYSFLTFSAPATVTQSSSWGSQPALDQSLVDVDSLSERHSRNGKFAGTGDLANKKKE